jgi:hypothetical protein
VEIQAIKDKDQVSIESSAIHGSILEGDLNLELHSGTITSLVLGSIILIGFISISMYQFIAWQRNSKRMQETKYETTEAVKYKAREDREDNQEVSSRDRV